MRRSLYKSIGFSLLSIWLLGCSKFNQKTAYGFEFQQHIDTGYPHAEVGQAVYVYFIIRTDEEVLFSAPELSGMRSILPAPKANPIKDPDPIADVLPLLGAGDSVTVRMPVTEDMRDAAGLATADYIYYEIAVRKVVTPGSLEDEPDEIQTELSVEKEDLLPAIMSNTAGQAAWEALLSFVQSEEPKGTQMASGLFYQLVEPGSGQLPTEGDRLSIRLVGVLGNGFAVEENYSAAEPFSFAHQRKRVIKAWDQGLALLRPGGKIMLRVPPALGFGATGKPPTVGPADTLYYYLELLEVQPPQ